MQWRNTSRKPTTRSIRRLDLGATQLASSETARHMNRDVVLELIRMHQPVSRAELSRLSGLQRSTISLITEQLMRERWVREGAVARLPRGRRPTLLGLNEDLALLVVDVHPGHATLAAVDLNGRFHSRTRLTLDGDPAASIRRIAEELASLRKQHPHLTFEGVGVSLPGRVDPQTQELIFAPNLQWQGQPIRQVIREITGLPTEMENGANAALLAELWVGHLEGVRDAVLVEISEGIGTGLLTNGQLVTGQRGMAGEFGHVPIDSAGPRCACGQHGCWEMFGSISAALRYYREAGGKAIGNSNGKATGSGGGDGEIPLFFADLLARARSGEAAAAAAIAKQAHGIGCGLRAVNAGLSPEVIIVAGDVVAAWDLYEPHLLPELSALSLGAAKAPRLVFVEDCETTRLHGAAAIVLQRNSLFRSHP